MNKIVKIGFEVQENWKRDEFRKFILSISKDTKLEKKFYVITSSFYATEAANIQTLLDLDSSQVVTNVTTYSDYVSNIQNLGINYFFHFTSEIVDLLNDDKILGVISTEPFKAFFVNWIQNNSTFEMKYIEKFKFELNRFLNA